MVQNNIVLRMIPQPDVTKFIKVNRFSSGNDGSIIITVIDDNGSPYKFTDDDKAYILFDYAQMVPLPYLKQEVRIIGKDEGVLRFRLDNYFIKWQPKIRASVLIEGKQGSNQSERFWMWFV